MTMTEDNGGIGCVLDLPLHELDGDSFMSKDAYGHECTNSGSKWTPHGREFDGTNMYVGCGNDASLNHTDHITGSIWIRPAPGYGNMYPRLIDHHASSRCYMYIISATGILHAILNIGGADTGLVSPDPVPTSAWTQYVFTFDGAALILYENGVVIAQSAESGSIGTATMDLHIGNSLAGTRGYDGLIDEVRIYNRALTPAEIQRDYIDGRDTSP